MFSKRLNGKSRALYITLGFIFIGLTVAEPLAYWRFEEGPAAAAVTKPFGATDSSGNGNHLDPWTQAGNSGFGYRTDVGSAFITQTGIPNFLSVQNTGGTPSLITRSTTQTYGPGSFPAGVDIETVTPGQFTIEAFFKPEGNSNHRTIVGRDAASVAGHDSNLAALYFKIRPDDGVEISFADVSGYWHAAESDAGLIQGFDWETDPQGLTGTWYFMAAVSDGSVLSLYLADLSAATVPQLVDQTNMVFSGSPNRALAKGSVSGSDWHAGGWSVGRGLWNGVHTDRAYGFIDEVRISATALSPDQFLLPDPSTDRNPVMDGADPDILLVDNTVWMYTTSGPQKQFFAYSSNDLVNWQTHGPILDFDDIPWIPADKSAWAPGVFQKNGTYYLYYSVGPKPSHIGVATSSSPGGPFTDSGGPLLSDNNDPSFEAIDAMVFTNPNSGTSYLYAGGSAGSRLRVFELNTDMISFAQEITVSNPYQFTEGAFMHYYDGLYYMSYSHGSWNYDSYSVHYSTASGPAGPWTYRGLLMQSDATHKGPGHHSFLYNAAMDEWYIFYHRWNDRAGSGPYSGSRSIAIENMHYNANGTIQPFVLTDTGVGPVWLGNTLRADFNENGTVALEDIRYLADVWLTADEKGDLAPVGGDGIVDLYDFAGFALQWLK